MSGGIRPAPELADEEAAEVVLFGFELPSRCREGGGVIREPLRAEMGQETKGAIEQRDEWEGQGLHPAGVGNGEFGDEPEGVGRGGAGELASERGNLGGGEAVEEEVGDDEVRGILPIFWPPMAQVGLFGGEPVSESPSAPAQGGQHGGAAVDGVNAQGGRTGEEARGEASVAIAENESASALGGSGEETKAAALETGAKARVLHPAIDVGEAVEVGWVVFRGGCRTVTLDRSGRPMGRQGRTG